MSDVGHTAQSGDPILVPLDDAAASQRSLRVAFSVAARSNSSVLLVRSCEPDEARGAEENLEGAGDRFGAVAPFSVRTLQGPPVQAVLDAQSTTRSLICMRTHARSALPRLAFGSVTEELIKRAEQPVLCVGPGVTDIALPGERIEALVCLDGSPAGATVVEAAASFATLIDADCVIAQVVGPDEDVSTSGGPAPRPIRDEAERRCSEAVEQLSAAGVSASGQVLHGDPARAIVQNAQRRNASFIVVGTTSKTGIDRFVLGSVAVAVVRHAHCPVLVVPTQRS